MSKCNCCGNAIPETSKLPWHLELFLEDLLKYKEKTEKRIKALEEALNQ